MPTPHRCGYCQPMKNMCLLFGLIVAAAAAMASASPSSKGTKVARNKGIMRLRRNPHLKRHQSLPSKFSLQDEELDAAARELNIFLRDVTSIPDTGTAMSMSLPPPGVAGPQGGTGDDILTTSAPSLTTGSTPKPIPLPTQQPTSEPTISAAEDCIPLDDIPDSEDIPVTISYTYELVIESDADINELLQAVETLMQDFLSSALSGCSPSKSKTLLFDLDRRRRLDIAAIDSRGLPDIPRTDICHTQVDNEATAACYVIDGGVQVYATPDDSTEDAISAHRENVLSHIEEKFGNDSFIDELPGVIRTAFIGTADVDADQAQDLPQSPQASNKESVSTTYKGLPIIGAVFLAVGIVGVACLVTYGWRRNQPDVDIHKGMERLDTSDSYQSDAPTNEVTATDVGDHTAEDHITEESPIFLDYSNDAQVPYLDTQGSDDSVSVDTGAAVRDTFLPPELTEFKQTNGDGDSVDFEAADGSGEVVSIATGAAAPKDGTEGGLSPYCYPSCLWPQDEGDSKI